VTAHVSVADLYAHRSGLPDHAGDDLEEIGYGRAGIIERLRLFELALDLVFLGEPSRDWFALYNAAFERALYPAADPDPRVPPPDAVPPRPASAYAGTYHNPCYGPADTVAGADGELVLVMGPARRRFP